jgi:hypothetical protein
MDDGGQTTDKDSKVFAFYRPSSYRSLPAFGGRSSIFCCLSSVVRHLLLFVGLGYKPPDISLNLTPSESISKSFRSSLPISMSFA